MPVNALAPLLPQASTATPGTLTTGNHYVVTAAAGTATATLPLLAGLIDGDQVLIEKDFQDTSSNAVAVTCGGANTFESGATTISLTTFGERLRLQAATIAGARVWKVVDRYMHPAAVSTTYAPLVTANPDGSLNLPDTGWGIGLDGSPTFYGVGNVPTGRGATAPIFATDGSAVLIPTGV